MSTGQVKEEVTKAGGDQASLKAKEPPRSILHKAHHTKPPQKTSLFKLCLDDDSRPGIGVCMIAFSIPLLVPGITLTAVAFDDETGFAKFSALHIIGMLMLAASVILLVAGILMRIKFKAKVAPDQLLSTHEKCTKELEAQSIDDKGSKDLASRSRTPPPPVNFMVETGNASAEGDHHVHFSTLKKAGSSYPEAEALPSKLALLGHDNPAMTSEHQDYSTSSEDDSEDSFDSEEISSGSYIIVDPSGSKRQSMESNNSKSPHDRTLQIAGINNSQDLCSGIEQNGEKHQSKANLESANNYFSETQPTTITHVHPSHFTFGAGDATTTHSGTNQDSKFPQSPQGGASFSRQRLQALRSDTNSPASLPRVQSTDIFSSNNNSVADLNGRCDSNASVFLSDNARRENSDVAAIVAANTSTTAKLESNNVRWSFPVATEGSMGNVPLVHSLRQSSGPLCSTSPLGQEHVASLTVVSR